MKREESERLSRSRRCMGGAVFYDVTGQPGRQSTAEMPESEDLPLCRELHAITEYDQV